MHLNNTRPVLYPIKNHRIRFVGFTLILILITGGFLISSVASRFMANWATTDDLKGTIYYTFEDYGFGVNAKHISYLQSLMNIPGRYLNSNSPPKLHLDIKFKHIQTLTQKRNAAMAQGRLPHEESRDFVPAFIRFNNRTIKVDLRLKGGQLYHVDTNRWSLRVKVKGDNHLFGMRRFSLHHPKVRDFQNEPLYMETLRQYGVLAPRTVYVKVVINGNEIGVMQMEDHFSKELLEYQKRREGVIVKFDESDLVDPSLRLVYDNYKNTTIVPFQLSKIERSPPLRQQNEIAHGLLRGFINGHLKASDVFDVESMGYYMAITQLWGVSHAASWRNIRFYLNPITLHLEPVGYDTEVQYRRAPGDFVLSYSPIIMQMLHDPIIEQAYLESHEKLKADIEDGSLIRKLKNNETGILSTLYNEFVCLESFNFDEIKLRMKQWPPLDLTKKRLQTEVADVTPEYANISPKHRFPQTLHLYDIQDETGKSYLEIANMIPHGVDITRIQWVDAGDHTYVPFTPSAPITYPMQLSATPLDSLPVSTHLYYEPLNRSDLHLDVTFSIHGSESTVTESTIPYFQALKISPLPQSNLLTRPDDTPPYLTLNTNERTVHIKKGQWRILESLIIPENYHLVIPPGTTLQFAEDAGLFVFGPMICEGTVEEPIVMENIPDTDQNGRWMGISVFKASRPSIWRHVQVRQTNGIQYAGWSLTGGVMFYKSDVTMQNCVFDGHQGEDALNIIHAEYVLDGVHMSNTKSDGFDSDFSNGSIVNCVFENIGSAGGGDAVDFSGSTVKIEQTRFKDITDKAVSIGEASNVMVTELQIESAGTGIACKDNSLLEIDQASFKRIKTAAIMAYIKKAEYGPARVTARAIHLDDDVTPAIVQTGSHITIDGNEIQAMAIDVDAMYDTIMKKGN